MQRPTSSLVPSASTRMADTCLVLSTGFGGQPSPRRQAPIPSSSAAGGRIFCGVALSCSIDVRHAIGGQAVSQPLAVSLSREKLSVACPSLTCTLSFICRTRSPSLAATTRSRSRVFSSGNERAIGDTVRLAQETMDEAHCYALKCFSTCHFRFCSGTTAPWRPGSDHIGPWRRAAPFRSTALGSPCDACRAGPQPWLQANPNGVRDPRFDACRSQTIKHFPPTRQHSSAAGRLWH